MNQSDREFLLSFSQIRLITAVLSLLMSAAAFYYDDIINRDGVMYMEMVATYLENGLAAMSAIYDWPFFSLLVAWISKPFHLPFEFTASALNCVLFAVFTDALLLISNKLLPNLRQTAIAALLILCFFTLNAYRDFIIRDIGYWAFMSLALYQLLRYQDEKNLITALLWQGFALLALLFRIEAAMLMLLAPLALINGQGFINKIKSVLPFYSLVIPLGVIPGMMALSLSGWADAYDKLRDYLVYLNAQGLSVQFSYDLKLLEDKILSPFSRDYSALILFSGLFVMLLYKLASDMSIAYLIILAMTVWMSTRPATHSYRRVLLWFLAINLVILTAFLFRQYFIISRYCIMTVSVIFLLLLPRMTQFIDDVIKSKHYWLCSFVAFLLLASVIDTFHDTNSKSYIRHTAIWASHHLKSTDSVLTDDEFIQYYVKREQTAVTITYQPKKLKSVGQFDYLILVEKKRHPNIMKTLELDGVRLEKIHKEKNQRGNCASVYKIVKK